MTHVISVSIVTYIAMQCTVFINNLLMHTPNLPPPHTHFHLNMTLPHTTAGATTTMLQIMSMLQPAEVFGEATRLVGLGSPLSLADKYSEGNC